MTVDSIHFFFPIGQVGLAATTTVKPNIPIDRSMVLIAFAFAAAWTVTGAMAAHFPRILEAAGATPVDAAAAGALIGPRLACLTHPLGVAIHAIAGSVASSVFAIFHGWGNGV